jgi:transcriptional regulator with XRE-family HTH domain
MPTTREQFVQTIRSQLLGSRMRHLREERGQTLKYIAAYLGVEFSTLARYERAEWPFRKDHVEALLDVYGVYDERQREELLGLAHNAWRVNQWEQDGGHNSATAAFNDRVFIDHWWAQKRAQELCVYQNMLIPDLLATRDYAEAVLRHNQGRESSAQSINQQVRQLIQRQQVLDDKPPKRLTVLIEEAALRRPVGGRAVLVQQLEHLVREVERPHVNIRILPATTGWHEGVYGPFAVCVMDRPYPPLVLLEHLGGRMIVEHKAAERYSNAFERLSEHALGATASMALITDLAERLDAGEDPAEHRVEEAG